MREIKFRGWDKKTKKMSDGFALFGEFTLLGAVHDWQSEMGNPAKSSLEALGDLEVMQYTGLKDKNGKEIYEGDILQFGDLICAVDYITDRFGFGWVLDKGKKNQVSALFYNTENHREFEIIGNIYQNPELLSSNNP